MIARRLLVAAQLSLILAAQLSGQSVSDFDRVVSVAADEGHFAGVVLVQVGGDDVYVSAVGDAVREFGIPHDRQTRFKFHSLTKPIVSVALYSLVADGRVDLQAPICDTWSHAHRNGTRSRSGTS